MLTLDDAPGAGPATQRFAVNQAICRPDYLPNVA